METEQRRLSSVYHFSYRHFALISLSTYLRYWFVCFSSYYKRCGRLDWHDRQQQLRWRGYRSGGTYLWRFSTVHFQNLLWERMVMFWLFRAVSLAWVATTTLSTITGTLVVVKAAPTRLHSVKAGSIQMGQHCRQAPARQLITLSQLARQYLHFRHRRPNRWNQSVCGSAE